MTIDPAGSQMTAKQLAQKVRWEGGLIEALEYGIGAEDIEDPALAVEWLELDRLWSELRPLLHAMAERLGINE